MKRIKAERANEIRRLVAHNKGLLLVHFGSPLASSCELWRRELDQVSSAFRGVISLVEVELPLQDIELIREYSIEEIPTVLVFRGTRPVERLTQVLPADELGDLLGAITSFYGSTREEEGI